jgi:hypothetical protein
MRRKRKNIKSIIPILLIGGASYSATFEFSTRVDADSGIFEGRTNLENKLADLGYSSALEELNVSTNFFNRVTDDSGTAEGIPNLSNKLNEANL